MSFDFSKLGAAFEQIEAAKKRSNYGGLGSVSAALGAVDRIGAGLDRIDAFGVGADLSGARGARIGSLASDILGPSLADVKGLGLAETKLTQLGRGLSALADPPDEGLLSTAAGLGKLPSGAEKPSWMESMSRVLGAAEKMPSPGISKGLGGAAKWRGFGFSTSPAGTDRDPWELGSTHWHFDAAREPSGLGKPGLLGDLDPGWADATALYGTGGLTDAAGLAKGSAAFGGLFETFDSIGEIVRGASGSGKAGMMGDFEPAWDASAASLGPMSGTIGSLGAGPLFGGWDGAGKLLDGFFRARDLLAPQVERWTRLAKELAEWAAREAAKTTPEDRLAAAAFEALEALEDGHHWETDRFLERHLNIRPSPWMKPYVHQALWMLLRADFDRPFGSPAKWRTLELRAATAYLSTAIYNEARRLKRDAELEDRLWWGECAEPPIIAPEVFPMGEHEDPADAVALLLDGRPPDDRVLVLDSLSLNGTGEDREIVRLVRDGAHDRAGIRNEVGSPRLQAFERKARRWRADEKY